MDIPRNILAQLLRSSTTQAPFKSPDGNLYLQIEGVAKGSPLGPSFANFYVGNLEQSVLRDQNIKPNIYCRYVDVIFVVVRNEAHLKQLQERMESSSVLSFIYKISVNGKIPFLDVNIKTQHGQFVSDVYRKTTNDGKLLNAKSDCPARYKFSVIAGGIRSAHKICSSEDLFNHELQRLRQILVNNGYTNIDFDFELNKFLHNNELRQLNDNNNKIKIYYKNQMSTSYKIDE